MSPASPPGPPAWQALRYPARMRRDPLGFYRELAREYGDVVLARLGPRRACVVSHPALIREVLVTQHRSFHKSPALKRTRRLLGDGLLTSEEEYHLRQRRLAQPAFHRERIAGYARSMMEHADRLSAAWREGAEVDAHREMTRLALAIAGETLFGADVAGEAEEIAAAVDASMETFWRIAVPFGHLLDHLPLPSNRRFHAARARMDATIHRLIRERRAHGADTGDLLSMLLLAQDTEGDGGGMSDEQVRDEALTLFLAGHETTANALAWSWYLLALHPEVDAKLHAEVDTALGGRLPGVDDLPALPYTRAVLAESMRLYPPAWIVGRTAIEPVRLGGFRIPAGTMVLMSQWVVHRDARFFADPERFRPERWTPEMEAALPRLAYFPFGAGPRKCIGESFAWTEGILVLATLARRWRLRLLPGQRVEPQPLITLRPRDGIRVRLEGR